MFCSALSGSPSSAGERRRPYPLHGHVRHLDQRALPGGVDLRERSRFHGAAMRSMRLARLVRSISSALQLGFFAVPTALAQGSLLTQFSSPGWNWDPWILASLMLALLGHICGLAGLDKTLRTRSFGWMRNLSFATGIATLFLALLSPFDALDDQLFSAHMVQHLVLLMVAPPLRISGRPALVTLWAFPLA